METVIVFIIILGILILVHELGHFVSAIKLGVDVEEFAIGFPPRIFSWTRKGIRYSLNWIPVGGFVKIKGESGDHIEDPKSFANQPAWKKMIIVSAGVLMNFVLAFVLLSAVFMAGFPQEITDDIKDENIRDKNVVVLELLADAPAQQAGIEVGDKILSVSGQSFTNSEEVYNQLEQSVGQPVDIKILKKDGQIVDYTLEHQVMGEGTKAVVGIGITETGIVDYGFFGSIWQGAKVTVIMIWRIIEALYHLLADLITKGSLAPGFGGPIAVAAVTGQIIQLGFINLVYFAALLSINLGVINFFPFPALDGGRALFIMAEAITRKKLNQKVEAWLHNSGFIILILLLVVITVRDFRTYGGAIWQAVKSWFV